MLGNGIAMTLGPALVNIDNIHNKTSGQNGSTEQGAETEFNLQGMGPANYSNMTVQQIKQEINTYMQVKHLIQYGVKLIFYKCLLS